MKAAAPKDATHIAISPNAGYVAACSSLKGVSYEVLKALGKATGEGAPDLDVYICKTGKKTPATKLKLSYRGVNQLTFVDDSRILVLDSSGEINMWNVANTTIIRKFNCKEGYARFFTVKETNHIISARYNGQMDIINYESGKIVISVQGLTKPVTALYDATQEGSMYFAGCSADNIVNIWDLSRKRSSDSCRIINGAVSNIHLYRGGENIICTGGSVVVLATKDMGGIRKINYNTKFDELKDFIVDNTEKWLMGYSDNSSFIRFSDLSTMIETPVDWHEKNIATLSANNDGSLLLSVDKGGCAILWRTKNRLILSRLTIERPNDGYKAHTIISVGRENTPPVSGAALSDDGNVAGFILHDGRMALWDLRKVKNKKAPKALNGFYNMIALLGQGKAKKKLFVSGESIYDVQSPGELDHEKQEECLQKLYAIANQNNIPKAEVKNVFQKIIENMLPVAFSKDGKRICYIEEGHLVYRDPTEKKIVRFRDEVDITAVKFLNDNRMITGNSLGKVYLLNFINT